MIIITCGRFTATPNRIANKIKELGGEARVITNYAGRKIRATKDDLVVNWGCPTDPVADCKILNEHIIGKKLQLAKMIASIPVPPFSSEPLVDGALRLLSTEKNPKVLARESHNFGGRGIVLCETYEEQTRQQRAGKDLFVLYIHKVLELRVHFAMGKVLGMSKKVPANENDVAWNNHNGAKQNKFVNVTMERFMLNLCKKAVKEVGYDFGAVDIIFDEFGRPYVLEVNSAPALVSSEDRLTAWAEAFIKAESK